MITDGIEYQILNSLIHDEGYSRKILPFLDDEYFQNNVEKTIFNVVKKYVNRYNKLPNVDEIKINVDEIVNLHEDTYDEINKYVGFLKDIKKVNQEWLVDKTEKWCQEKAIHNSILEAIQILDGKSQQEKGAIPGLLEKALGVSLDTNIGHDFIEQSEERFDYYHRKEERIPFGIDILNKVTRGGLPRKTLNIILAGTGVGKSLAMCDFAAHNLIDGKNVLYITAELAEEKIGERIDANLLDVPISEIEELTREAFNSKIDRLKKKQLGKLIIKEYPTASAGASHFRHLLNELRLKKNFIPDIIYIDYLNICISNRLKFGANVNSYTYVKSIAEELRGLAVEMNVPIVSATQTTRSGFSNTDPGLEDTSESFGLPATADFFIALVSSEELEKLDQVMIKQLKNRYSDIVLMKRFVVGIDRAKMRLYDCEDSAQTLTNVNPNPLGGPVFDNTNAGETSVHEDGVSWKPRTKQVSF
jgi:replicative DNA helicase